LTNDHPSETNIGFTVVTRMRTFHLFALSEDAKSMFLYAFASLLNIRYRPDFSLYDKLFMNIVRRDPGNVYCSIRVSLDDSEELKINKELLNGKRKKEKVKHEITKVDLEERSNELISKENTQQSAKEEQVNNKGLEGVDDKITFETIIVKELKKDNNTAEHNTHSRIKTMTKKVNEIENIDKKNKCSNNKRVNTTKGNNINSMQRIYDNKKLVQEKLIIETHVDHYISQPSVRATIISRPKTSFCKKTIISENMPNTIRDPEPSFRVLTSHNLKGPQTFN